MSALLLALMTCLQPATGGNATGPSMFLNRDEIGQIRAMVDRGEQPWAEVYQALVDECGGYLALRPDAVQGRFQYRPPPWLLPDTAPGEPSHEDKARHDSLVVRDLGLAYALTGDERYADKGAEFVAAWVRSMEPIWPFDQDNLGPMAVNTTLPAMFYGYDLMVGSRARTPELEAATAQWVTSLVDTCKVHHFSANGDSTGWNLTFMITGSVITGRAEDRSFVYGKTDNTDTFQGLLYVLFGKDGKANPSFLQADRFQGDDVYSALRRIKTYVYVAEVALHQGTDLYNWSRDGRGLRKSLTAYAPYFTGKLKLPGVKQFPLGRDADAWVYEIAHARWPDRVFEDVTQYLDRPGYDVDILGPVGLTHGYRGGAEKPPSGAKPGGLR